MTSKQHLLVLATSNPLQRWQQTFPNGQIVSLDKLQKFNADIVWLRLNPLADAQPQIQAVQAMYQAPLVVMSAIPNLNEALLAINLGARAYINCHAGPNNLNQVVNVIDNNGIWLGEDLMQLMTKQIAKQGVSVDTQSNWRDKLTEREIEVVLAVVKGLPNKLIARELDIAERTVKAHLSSIFAKLEVSDRLKLVLLVTQK